MFVFRKKITFYFFVTSLTILLAGCVTDELANKQDVYMVRTQVNEQVIHMEDRINALEGRADAIQKRQEDIQRSITSLEDTINNKMFTYENDMKDMRVQITDVKKNISSDFEKKMDVILEEVIKENQKIADKINSLQKEKYDLGLYHTVERGDILSKIAVKYGVSVDAIIEANEIENPDRLKVGQKLFIPQ
jgi:LysM repeat protein